MLIYTLVCVYAISGGRGVERGSTKGRQCGADAYISYRSIWPGPLTYSQLLIRSLVHSFVASFLDFFNIYLL